MIKGDQVKRMTKIPFKGKLIEAERINVKSHKEEWNTYDLEDGTKLRVKLVLAAVFKLKGIYKEDTGEPIYVIKTDNIIDAQIPDELYKIKEER